MAAVVADDSTEMERPDFVLIARTLHPTLSPAPSSNLKTSILNDTAANLWMQYEDYLRYGYGWGMDDVGRRRRARVL